MSAKSFRDLVVWQLAMQLAHDIERLASTMPNHERYGLASQLRRASTSIPSNIAEGSARPTLVYINHVRIALGSEAELKTHLEHARRVGLISESDLTATLARASQVGRMLNGLIKGLRDHHHRKGKGTRDLIPDP